MFTALRATSLTLAECLRQRLISNTELGQFFDSNQMPGNMVVTLNSPQEMTNQEEGLSVWLYQVVRDGERLNALPERISNTQVRRVPLPVHLHYLMTPLVTQNDASETEQLILGKVLQVFHDHPILRGTTLQGELSGTEVELHVRLEPMTLEEITRVWDSLESSYQLSVSYEVSVVLIESAREPEDVSPVQVVIPEYGIIVSK